MPFSSSPLDLSFFVGLKPWSNINFLFWGLLCNVYSVYFLLEKQNKTEVSDERSYSLAYGPRLSISSPLILVPPLSLSFNTFEAQSLSYSIHYYFWGTFPALCTIFTVKLTFYLSLCPSSTSYDPYHFSIVVLQIILVFSRLLPNIRNLYVNIFSRHYFQFVLHIPESLHRELLHIPLSFHGSFIRTIFTVDLLLFPSISSFPAISSTSSTANSCPGFQSKI